MSQALTREIEELRLLMGSSRDPHGRVFAQLGDALRRAGSHREALSVLLDGVTEHPNFSPGHLVLGWTAQESGDVTVARTAFERTVELDPENPNGLFGLGSLLALEGDPRGRALIEEAESLDAGVRSAAPEIRGGIPEADAITGGQDPALEHLPFLALDEMAPDTAEDERAQAPAAGDELFGLPFVSLDDLGPDSAAAEAPEHETGEGDPDVAAFSPLESLPFMPLDELRPDPVAQETPSTADDEAQGQDDVGLGGTLATRTMGELLVRQGLTVQAVEVFEALVERSPDDSGLRERLSELRAQLSGAGASGASEGEGEEPMAEAATANEGEGADVDPEGSHDAAAHPSMDPPVPHPEVPSPFHPTTDEADDGGNEEEREIVGDYFSRLLAWSPQRSEELGGGTEPPSDGEEHGSS